MEDRITELEIKVSHQEKTIDELNEVVIKQWAEIDQLKKKIEMMKASLEEDIMSLQNSANAMEKPPHY